MSDTTITLRGRIGTDLRVSKTANNHVTIRFAWRSHTGSHLLTGF